MNKCECKHTGSAALKENCYKSIIYSTDLFSPNNKTDVVTETLAMQQQLYNPLNLLVSQVTSDLTQEVSAPLSINTTYSLTHIQYIEG